MKRSVMQSYDNEMHGQTGIREQMKEKGEGIRITKVGIRIQQLN